MKKAAKGPGGTKGEPEAGAVRKRRGKRAAGASEAAPSAEDRRRVVAELRAFAHPLRLRLYELFAEKPRTTMQVAEILGEPPTRLYHHVNALQKSGLLRLKETRPIRGTIEKYFEAIRPSAPAATGGVLLKSAAARQSARAAAASVFEQARQDVFAEMHDLAKSPETAPMLVRMLLGASPAGAMKLRTRLLELVKELKEECGEEPEGSEERWSLTLAFARAWPRRPGPRG